MLLVGILTLDFILEVKLERLVLHLDVLDFTLESGHVALLPVQLDVHLVESLSLLLFDLLHACIYRSFPKIQLLVFVFEVGETVFQGKDRVLLAFIDIFVVRNDLLQEFCVFV